MESVRAMLGAIEIPPSAYAGWLLPAVEGKSSAFLDALAHAPRLSNGSAQFLTVADLYPSLLFCALFGVARLVLTRVFFRPLALFAMRLEETPQTANPSIDAYVERNALLASSPPQASTDHPSNARPPTAPEKSGPGARRAPRSKTSEKLAQEIWSGGVERASLAAAFGGAEGSAERVRAYIQTRRRNEATQKRVVKFVEALWRGVFYLLFCLLGAHSLFFPPQPWLADTTQHWAQWPQPVAPLVVLYYQLAMGCYLHQLMWTEVSRSDAVEMIVHHLTTILLIGLSFLTGFTRIGASILLVHDIADVFLESAKCFNYTAQFNKDAKPWAQPLCDALFALFAVSFFATRLIIYPRYLLYSLVMEAPVLLGGVWPGYYIFAGLLLVLQVLHVFWFYLITKMVVKMFTEGIKKDERSDDEDEEEEEGQEEEGVGAGEEGEEGHGGHGGHGGKKKTR